MKKFLLVLFLLILTAQSSEAQIRGLDLLGLAKLDRKMILQQLPSGSAIGVLAGTFGNAQGPLEEMLQSGKVSAVRIHLLNGACWRGKNCEATEPKLSDIEAIGNRARVFSELIGRYPSVQCFLSPVLEYDERNPSMVRQWVGAIQQSAPGCRIVLSPGSGITIGGYLIERHGNSYGRADIRSNDGESLFDAPRDYPSEGSTITLGWVPSFNLRRAGERTFVPPSRRNSILTSSELSKAIGIMRGSTDQSTTSPIADQSAPNLRSIGCEHNNNPRDGTDGFVWKLSERGKAVWLAPPKFQSVFKRVDIVSNGKVFDILRYREQFSEHGRPYRGIYDGNRTLDKYPQNSVLRADKSCWILKDPTQRID